MVTFGAVKEKEYQLLEQGEYVLTLNDIAESTGAFGDRIVWKFLVAPVNDPTNYINKRLDGSGDEKDIWAFTDPDIVIGSLQHEFIEKLTGRTFVKGSALPSEDELLGRRIIAYINHYTPKRGKNAGVKQEQILAGSVKPFRGPQPNKVIVAGAPVRNEPDEDETARQLLVDRANKIVGRAVKLETPSHGDWIGLDMAELSVDALEMVIRDATAEVQAALDA